MANIKVLKDLVAVNLGISIWTARKKMNAQDLGNVQLPPAQLASLGSKRIADPAKLNAFMTIKYKAVAYLDRIGIRFLGGWAIPASKADEATAELSSLRKEFLAHKDAFLNDYDDGIKDWIARNHEWEEIIKNSVVGSDYVRSRLSFDWQMYSVAPAETSSTNSQTFNDQVSKIGETLFGEISKAVSDIWESSFEGKLKVRHNSLRPLVPVLEKLRSMAFVDPLAAPATELLDQALSLASKGRGAINGDRLQRIQGVLCMLRDPQLLQAHCSKIVAGTSVDDVLDDITQAMRPQTPSNLPPADEEGFDEEAAETEDSAETEEAENQGLGIQSYGLW